MKQERENEKEQIRGQRDKNERMNRKMKVLHKWVRFPKLKQ